ncbi:MAG: hypothetical protein ACE367_27525 [Acidimicrobiales bacterium]
MDPVDLDSLAWRAVELAVQRRHDPRLIVATRPAIVGPTSTARLLAGLCNAAAGRRVVALFGVDGTDVIGVDDVPDERWIDTVAARFPGVVPSLATATIDADGARIVALTADDPGTLVAATRSGRVVIPWFDGSLADRPPTAGVDRAPTRPAGRIEVRSGWLERTGPCPVDPAVPAIGTDDAPSGSDEGADRAVGADETGSDDPTDADATTGAGTGLGMSTGSDVVVWRGVLDIALALDPLTVASGADAATAAATVAAATPAAAATEAAAVAAGSAPIDGTGGVEPSGTGPDGFPAQRRRGVAIADRDVSVTLLADGSSAALSLDVQAHPTPGAAAAIRSDGGVVLDPMLPCRLYLAAAAATAVFDRHGELGGAVRLLVSLRFPGDDRLVATMATLDRDTAAASLRWTL